MKSEKIQLLLAESEPEEQPLSQKKHKEFDPKFNIREEFALWVRQEFPELKDYAKKRMMYALLEERRTEVYEAAIGAVMHGGSSTTACAKSRLYRGWKALKGSFKESANKNCRAKGLELFVEAIEDLSISLGGNQHYTDAGQHLGSYFGHRAFIYRLGDEDSKETRYLVLDKPLDVSEAQKVLIGEFTELSEWELKRLKELSQHFKGSEEDYRTHIDKELPESGAYSSGGYTLTGSKESYYYGKYTSGYTERYE